jgi:hypothetical protein
MHRRLPRAPGNALAAGAAAALLTLSMAGTAGAAGPGAGTLAVQPSHLWNDGTSYHGLSGDAFGVWRFLF